MKTEAAPSGDHRGTNTAIVVWLVTVLLAGLALLRWFGTPESWGRARPVLIGAVGITPYAAAVCLLVLGYALWRAGWGQRVLVLSLTLLFVAWTLSDVQIGGTDDVIVAADIRIATGNVHAANDDPIAFVDELLGEEPDVIMLQEVSPAALDAFERHAPLAPYTERLVTGDERGGRLIYSRLPLGDEAVEALPPSSIAIATVDVGGLAVELLNVHLAAPVGGDLSLSWDRQLRDLSARTNQRTMPMILVGDFNATVHHAEFRLLIEKGLTDAHEEVGSGAGFSWAKFGIPLMRIDHALSSDELEPVRIVQLDGVGSDHASLVVDYRVVRD